MVTSQGKDDIVLTLGIQAQVNEFIKLESRITNTAKKIQASLVRTFQGLSTGMSGRNSIADQQAKLFTVPHEMMKKAAIPMANALKMQKGISMSAEEMTDAIVSNQKQQKAYWDNYYKGAKNAKKITTETKKAFDMNALGIMFFGMAITRVTNSISKSSTKMFQDIQHSIDGNVTSFDKANTQFSRMQYAIGTGLQPIVEAFIPALTILANIMSEHPYITAGVITAFTVLGTVLAVGGTLTLGMKAVTAALKEWTVLAPIVSGLMKGLGVAITGIGIAINWVMANPWTLWIAGIIAALVWIWKLQEAMGGFGEFFKSVARGILRIYALIADALATFVTFIVNKISDLLNWIIEKLNKIPGININATIGNIDYEWGDLQWGMQDFIDDSALAPSQGYATGGGLVPTYITNNIYTNDSEQLLSYTKAQSI